MDECESKCSLKEDYVKFFNEKQLRDIQFIVGPEEIKIMAHIAFVAARSEYLRTMILAARKAKQQTEKISGSSSIENLLKVRLANANPGAFEIILYIIYTDATEILDTINNIILLIDVYQLDRLFLLSKFPDKCIDLITAKIDKLNILETLIYADENKIQAVKDICIHFLNEKDNLDVIMSNDFSELNKPLLLEIINKKNDFQKKSNHILNRKVAIGKKSFFPNTSKHEFIFGGGNCVVNSKFGCAGTGTLMSDMKIFLESTGKDLCDIELVLDGHVIKAHKCILSARTQYFQAMFRSFMPADNKVNISIGDIVPSVEAFQVLLRYIYYGETAITPQIALYLLQATDFYGFSNNRLDWFCKIYLEHNINQNNVLETLEVSEYIQNMNTKAKALKWIAKNLQQVSHLPKFSDLSRELLLDILRTNPENDYDFHF